MIRLHQRRQFDALLDAIVAALPASLQQLLEQVPLVVEDEPAPQMLIKMGLDPRRTELCGLHWGTPLTRRSVEHGVRMPDQIMLFRGPIMRLARYSGNRSGRSQGGDELAEQIRITLLHEIGHHFGLDEDDLADLGYG